PPTISARYFISFLRLFCLFCYFCFSFFSPLLFFPGRRSSCPRRFSTFFFLRAPRARLRGRRNRSCPSTESDRSHVLCRRSGSRLRAALARPPGRSLRGGQPSGRNACRRAPGRP